MVHDQSELVRIVHEKAAALPATVMETADLDEAMRYVAHLCATKAPRENLLPGDNSLADSEAIQTRLIAAPDIGDEAWAHLNRHAQVHHFLCLDRGLRDHVGGIDLGVARAELVVADTATCVVACNSEEVRLATMLSEICVILASKSRIVGSIEDTAPTLRALQSGTAYTAFITGPSRTADIERVAALGVHGPLELHIVLVNDTAAPVPARQ